MIRLEVVINPKKDSIKHLANKKGVVEGMYGDRRNPWFFTVNVEGQRYLLTRAEVSAA